MEIKPNCHSARMNWSQRIIFLILLVSLAVTTNTCFAYFSFNDNDAVRAVATCHPPIHKYLHDGFYAGVSAGYDTYQIRITSAIPTYVNPRLAAFGFSENIFGGYGQYYCWFYYAGEISATATAAGSSFSNSFAGVTHNSHANVRVSYAGSILAGISLSDTSLIYIRIGAVHTSLNIKEFITASPLLQTEENHWIDGARAGIGIETGIFDRVSIRGEYSRTYYGTEGSDLGTGFNPSQGQIMISLIYHICY